MVRKAIMKRLLTILMFLLVVSISAQTKNITIDDLSSLEGTWKSQLEKKYENHPMIKKLNPDRRPDLMKFTWGVDKKIMHMSISNIDRPSMNDTTLFIEGILIPNPADTSVRMVEFNAQSDIYFSGFYTLDGDGNIIRVYEVGFTNGTTMKFREKWVWVDDQKQAFDWYTEAYQNGEYKTGDIVVRNTKLK